MADNDTQPQEPTTSIVWTADQELAKQRLLHEQMLQLERERTARLITLGMLAGFGAMMLVTYGLLILASDPIYGRAKDLLLFINPLIGIVIGYYFNKVTTEVRAEKAEAAVQTANTAAQTAEGEKKVAEVKANQAETHATEAAGALRELADATRDTLVAPAEVLVAKSKGLGTEDIENGASPDLPTAPVAHPSLQRAISRAEQVLARVQK